MKPVLLVIAGPNGSGKTTVTVRLRAERWSEGVEYINPDDIAQERFAGWNDRNSVLAAARWASTRREELLTTSAGIAFETVLSAPDKIDFVARAVAAGYFVRVFFVGTTDPTINAARVAARVMKGGHVVPIEKILSRYARSMANLHSLLALANRVYIYDNSRDGVDAALCAQVRDGELKKILRPAARLGRASTAGSAEDGRIHGSARVGLGVPKRQAAASTKEEGSSSTPHSRYACVAMRRARHARMGVKWGAEWCVGRGI